MNTTLKILLAAILLTAIFNRGRICEHLGFGQAKPYGSPIAQKNEVESFEKIEEKTGDYSINETLYRWDEQLLDWIPVEETPEYEAQLVNYNQAEHPAAKPIPWELLMDIRYKLRYFSELEMEIYAPVFPEVLKILDGKEVTIKGFVIPFDKNQDEMALSAYPYASCFFCGKASPASVMSMYLEDKRNRYKIDDFKKFRGTLHLNYDDPNEFYYILRNATEE